MYGKDFEAELERHEAKFPPERKRAALLLALHAVQDRQGHVPVEAVHWLAERYEISAAEIQGVLSFYTMFFTENPGEHVIWLCRTFPCELMGAGRVKDALEEALGCKLGETSSDGAFRVRWMECLGACDAAPCALIDDDMYECITPGAVSLVLDHVRAGGGGGRIVTGDSGTSELLPLDLAGRK